MKFVTNNTKYLQGDLKLLTNNIKIIINFVINSIKRKIKNKRINYVIDK